MSLQTIIVLTIVAGATAYVVRRLWPSRKRSVGCDTCPQNRARRDDYV